MKTFICAKNEAVVINGEVVVTVIDILNKKVVLAVDAQIGLKSSQRKNMMERRSCPLADANGFEDQSRLPMPSGADNLPRLILPFDFGPAFLGSLGEHSSKFSPVALYPGDFHGVVAGGLVP